MAGTNVDDSDNYDLLDEALSWADEFQKLPDFAAKSSLQLPPTKKCLILTCFDARIFPADIFGLQYGEAHVVRNAGGSAEAALRDIVLSQRLLGTEEVFLVKHDDCEMLGATDDAMAAGLRRALGGPAFAALRGLPLHALGAAGGVEQAVRDDRWFLQTHPALRPETIVHGLVYSPRTGAVREVDMPNPGTGGPSFEGGKKRPHEEEGEEEEETASGSGSEPEPEQAGEEETRPEAAAQTHGPEAPASPPRAKPTTRGAAKAGKAGKAAEKKAPPRAAVRFGGTPEPKPKEHGVGPRGPVREKATPASQKRMTGSKRNRGGKK